MSQAAPFSGLIEMPDTGPPATDSDVETAETGGEPQSGGFKAFWQNHQMIMMVIGLGVLLLTAVLVFRKSASNNAANNTTQGGGVPTTNTSDTATAIDQQNNAIEALLNAFQQWQTNQNPTPVDQHIPVDKIHKHWPTDPGPFNQGEWSSKGLPTYGPDARTYVKVGENGVPNTLAGIAQQLGISVDTLAGLNQTWTADQQITAGTLVRTGGTAPWEYPSTGSFVQASLPSQQSTMFPTSQLNGQNVTNIAHVATS